MKKIKLEDLIQQQQQNSKTPSFFKEKEDKEKRLIQKIKKNEEMLKNLQKEMESQFSLEDKFYRFYHHSFKVYGLQEYTLKMVNTFCDLMEVSQSELNKQFIQIIWEGTNKQFTKDCNLRWDYETRPIVEAFFHAKHMLDMMITYGLDENIKKTTGWVTILCLYNIR